MDKLEGSTFTPVEMPKNPEVKFAKPVEEFAAFGNAPPPAPAANAGFAAFGDFGNMP